MGTIQCFGRMLQRDSTAAQSSPQIDVEISDKNQNETSERADAPPYQPSLECLEQPSNSHNPTQRISDGKPAADIKKANEDHMNVENERKCEKLCHLCEQCINCWDICLSKISGKNKTAHEEGNRGAKIEININNENKNDNTLHNNHRQSNTTPSSGDQGSNKQDNQSKTHSTSDNQGGNKQDDHSNAPTSSGNQSSNKQNSTPSISANNQVSNKQDDHSNAPSSSGDQSGNKQDDHSNVASSSGKQSGNKQSSTPSSSANNQGGNKQDDHSNTPSRSDNQGGNKQNDGTSTSTTLTKNPQTTRSEETTNTQPFTVTNSDGSQLRVQIDEKVGSGIKRFFIGEKPTIFAEEKVLMLVGVTPDAKRNAIYGIFNYKNIMLGPINVSTNEITVYTVYLQKDDYTLTIINTPSFEGLVESEITTRITQFLQIQPCESALDAIGYVVDSSLTRRSYTIKTHKAIYQSMIKTFNNIEIIPLIFNLSDTQKSIDAIRDIGIESAYFLFNDTKNDNWSSFFSKLNHVEAQRLELLSELLEHQRLPTMERQQLQTTIKGLQPQISRVLIKIEEMHIRKEQIVAYKNDIKSTKPIKYRVTKKRKVNTPGQFATTCKICNHSCHSRCLINQEDDNLNCFAIDSSGKCTVCPKKCEWTEHKDSQFVYQIKETDMESKSPPSDGDTSEIDNHLTELNCLVFSLIRQAAQSITRLRKIKWDGANYDHNPVTVEKHIINWMIETEKIECKQEVKSALVTLSKSGTDFTESTELWESVLKWWDWKSCKD